MIQYLRLLGSGAQKLLRVGQRLVVPTGAPADVVASFSKALQTALADTRTKARLQAMGVEPMPGTAAQMGSFARTEREKWGRVITKVGVKLD